ncbi:MAG: outer membrane beta-barrel protein [bacterium]
MTRHIRKAACISLSIALATLPALARAQVGASIGGGVGIAGSTDQSLSDGQSGWVINGQITTSLTPLLKVGGEVDHLHHTGANATFGTAIAELSVPVVPFYIKAGAGYGKAEVNDGGGSVSGFALQLGAGYKIGLPGSPIGLAVFGNAYFAHGSSRYAQMVDAGLAFRL